MADTTTPATTTTTVVAPTLTLSGLSGYLHVAVTWMLIGVLAGGVGGFRLAGGLHPAPAPAPAVTLKSVSVSPPTMTLATGASQQFTAVGLYSDGSSKPIPAKWSSVFPAVCTIDASGLARGLANGVSMVVAEADGQRSGATVTVGQPGPGPQPTPPDPTPPKPDWIPDNPPAPPTPTPNPMGAEKPAPMEWRPLSFSPGWEGYGREIDGKFMLETWRRAR